MNHESQQSHVQASESAVATSERIEPGQASRTSLLRKPDHAVASGLVQRKNRDGNGVADDAEHAVAAASSSSGSPLPELLMRKFEDSLGADLSGVRVHTGASSAAANDAVGAKAYTIGNDIHFGAGNYDPSSSAGEHLLAHEVAHTVQQSGGIQRMQFKLEVSSPGDHHEHEADRAADAMIVGAPATIAGASGLARKAKTADKNFSANEKIDKKRISTLITAAKAFDQRVADTASGWGGKLGEMIDMLTGAAGALHYYDEMTKKYKAAYDEFQEALKKSDEDQKQVDEWSAKALEMIASTAVGLALGPSGLAVAEVIKSEKVAEFMIEHLAGVAADALVKIVIPPATSSAETSKEVIQSPELKQLEATKSILGLTSRIGTQAAKMAKLAAYSPAFVKVVENLTALLNSGGTADGTIMAPSECETAVGRLAAVSNYTFELDRTNGRLFALVKEVQSTARKQNALMTKESALKQIWSKWNTSGLSTQTKDPGVFGPEEMYPSGGSDGHHKEMDANNQIGKMAVVTKVLSGSTPGEVSVNNGKYAARAYVEPGTTDVAASAGAPCKIIGVSHTTLIVDTDVVPNDDTATCD